MSICQRPRSEKSAREFVTRFRRSPHFVQWLHMQPLPLTQTAPRDQYLHSVATPEPAVRRHPDASNRGAFDCRYRLRLSPPLSEQQPIKNGTANHGEFQIAANPKTQRVQNQAINKRTD